MRNVETSRQWNRRGRAGQGRLRNTVQQRQQWYEFVQDIAAAPTVVTGRYEGSVQRESDGSTFLRAIELGTLSGNLQSIRIYEQLGGSLPSTPQYTGDAFLFGNNGLFFATTDSVADRKYMSLVFGNFMFSFSVSTYHDERPDVKLAGMLRKQ